MIKKTNIVSKDDYNKIKSMVHHRMGFSGNLFPGVYVNNEGYQIDGIAHLDQEILRNCETKASLDVLRGLYTEVFTETHNVQKVKVSGIKSLGKTKKKVYDVSMKGNDHYFFANGILVHNTDSTYFSIPSHLKATNDDTELSKDDLVQLYETVGKAVDQTFPEFMDRTFNTGIEKGSIVAADLELIGTRGLFLKKKRYGILKFWEDGKRLDKNSHGKLKAMGIEIKRSDTPKFIQDHLQDVFIDLLVGSSVKDLKDKIMDFKKEFKSMDPWRKGTPKTVKNLSNKTREFYETGKCSVGHALASIHWNILRNDLNDHSVPEITDGTKIIVCKLKTNPNLKIDSIAFPSELIDKLPQWFRDLPFDVESMEEGILIKKLDNLFGKLDMDLGIHDDPNNSINNTDLFDW